MQALTKLGRWRKHFRLKIIAVSCVLASVPKELGGLGPKNRYTSLTVPSAKNNNLILMETAFCAVLYGVLDCAT